MKVTNTNVTKLPYSSLLALAASGFITILTEALPAGLLPQMSADLKVSESLIGQLVTMYAIGSLLAAIPLTSATRLWRRKSLLITAIAGFAVVNIITAVSTNYMITLAARLFAGVFAGLLWALLAGYAGRMVHESLKGKAIAVAMIGAPLALSLGIPAGTFLGAAIGWQYTFGVMSLLTLLLIVWVLVKVPDFPGQPETENHSLQKVLSIPGIKSILFVTLTFVLAHNILYTYIAPILTNAGLIKNIDIILFLFGSTALLGIWLVGISIDRLLRQLVLMSTALFGLAAIAIYMGHSIHIIIYLSIALWGLAFGGAATLFQTASANTAGSSADLAQSMIVTAWNLSIAGGGLIGGILLETNGTNSLSLVVFILLIPTFIVALKAKQAGFPVVCP